LASNNQLESLPPFPLSISKIDVQNNQLKSIENLFNSQQKKLREMDFSHNQISEIFLIPPCCSSINFSYNQLKEFKFKEIPYISMVKLSHNKIETISVEDSTLEHLSKLDLGHNQITEIPRNLLLNSFHLEQFILSHNNISSLLKFEITDEEYNEIKERKGIQLRKLYLGFNQIDSLSEKFFELSNRLSEFDCSWNQLKSIPKSISSLHLSFLSLSGNHLKDDSLEIILAVEPKLKQLIISDNEFKEIPKFEKKHRECIQDKENNSVGNSEMIGKRSTSEDATVIADDLDSLGSFYAVFDGHGGSKASEICGDVLISLLQSHFDPSKPESIKDVFDSLEKIVCEKCSPSEGTTATIIHIKEDKLTCANVGDTRAILCSKTKSKQLSVEHKSTDRVEHDYIRSFLFILILRSIHGFVTKDSRVQGVIAISRSLGDHTLKGFLSSNPDILSIDLDRKEDEYIILCCDGVWDVLNNDEVRELIDPQLSPSENARKIRDCAFSLGSSDNISSVVIKLK
jgi:serine/threonine protein phosphatase PrpC